MATLIGLIQGAAEYGALAGEAARGTPAGRGPLALLRHGLDVVRGDSLVLVGVVVSLLVVVALLRTRGYRS